MKIIVTRTALVLIALAMALFAWAGVASAQTDYTPGAPQENYDGPYRANAPVAPVFGSGGFGSPSATASADAASGDSTVGGTGGGLAVTGSQTSAPVFAAITLMGAGGVALVAARRRDS